MKKKLLIVGILSLCTMGLFAQSIELVKDINPGGEFDGRPDRFFAISETAILFRGDTEAEGRELWITDGTEGGTQLLKNIDTTGGNSNPNDFIVYNDLVFFSADDDIHGRELWVTDGTEEGTRLFKDIQEGDGNGAPRDFVVYKNLLWFTATTENESSELWVSDGTEEGTTLFLDINPGSGVGNPTFKYVAPTQDLMYFTATTAEEGTEMWVSDGTVAGTRLLADIEEGPDRAFPSQYVESGTNVIFRASTDSLGRELYITDGTTDGTRLIKDLYPGEEGSNPDEIIDIGLSFLGNITLFFAEEDTTGERIYAYFAAGDTIFEYVNTNLGNATNPGIAGTLLDFVYYFTADLTVQNNSGGFDTFGKQLFIVDPWGLILPGEAGEVKVMTTLNNLDPDVEDVTLDLIDYFIYFSAEVDPVGRELFRVPFLGNFQNLQLVTDINPDAASSDIDDIIAFGKTILFEAQDDGTYGKELFAFRSKLGTLAVDDLNSTTMYNDGDTIDLGIVSIDFDTTLVFEAYNRESDVAMILDTAILEGDGYELDNPPSEVFFSELFSGTPMSDTFSVSYAATGEGNVDVATVTLYSRFSSNDTLVFYIKTEVDIESNNDNAFANDWRLSPNPLQDEAILSGSPLEAEGKAHVVDTKGKLIRTFNLSAYQNQQKLQLADLPSGTYFLRLENSYQQASVIPFVKQ